jgi:hypothetical protein
MKSPTRAVTVLLATHLIKTSCTAILLLLLLVGTQHGFALTLSPIRSVGQRYCSWSPHYGKSGYYGCRYSNILHASEGNEEEDLVLLHNDRIPDSSKKVLAVKEASKRAMLGFAIPALGIYLTNPLLSNIDNAFVGRTIGTAGLAALSPATICTDQMLYLFSFLGRATTGLVSRAYACKDGQGAAGGDTESARAAASARTLLLEKNEIV